MSFYPMDPFSIDTTAPYKRTVGMEVEIASGGELVEWLHTNGYTEDDTLHGYHCSCSSNDYPIHSTEDTTAYGGEYLIGGKRGVLYGSAPFMTAIDIMQTGMMEVRAGADMSVGMHVHVGLDGLSLNHQKLLLRNYLIYQQDFLVFAAGPFNRVRSNGCTIPWLSERPWTRNQYDGESFWDADLSNHQIRLPGRPTLNFGNGRTVEFRVWNTARTKWRMMLAAGLSSAMVEAAAQERSARKEDSATLEEFLSGLLTPDLLGLMRRQRAYQEKLNPNGFTYEGSNEHDNEDGGDYCCYDCNGY